MLTIGVFLIKRVTRSVQFQVDRMYSDISSHDNKIQYFDTGDSLNYESRHESIQNINQEDIDEGTANLTAWWACFYSLRFWQFFFIILFGSIPHFQMYYEFKQFGID